LLLAGESVARLSRATGGADHTVRVVAFGQDQCARGVRQLTDRAKRIAKEVLGTRRIDLRDAARSIKIGMRAIVKGLGQTGGQGRSRPRILNDPQGASLNKRMRPRPAPDTVGTGLPHSRRHHHSCISRHATRHNPYFFIHQNQGPIREHSGQTGSQVHGFPRTVTQTAAPWTGSSI